MIELTLLRRNHTLSRPSEQRQVLEQSGKWPSFGETLRAHDLPVLQSAGIEVLQVNVGKVCNQTCSHCHVDAGPDRRESMSRETAEAVVDTLQRAEIPTLDITGGAPEMNPHFGYLVEAARELGCRVIDRCNLTILLAPRYERLAEFLAANDVEIDRLAALLSRKQLRQPAWRRSVSTLDRSTAATQPAGLWQTGDRTHLDVGLQPNWTLAASLSSEVGGRLPS